MWYATRIEGLAPRTYNDPCGIARALDLVGERWALLVVRELLLGPKRFSQLRRGLHDASPNVLAQRLRELETAGLVRRYRLDPPADVVVYELTERGYALEPVLLELGRWGSHTPITTRAELGVDALMLALKTRFSASRAAGLQATLEVRLEADRFQMEVAGEEITIRRGPPGTPAVTVRSDASTFRGVVFGRQKVQTAIDSGKLEVQGDRAMLEQFLQLFAD